MWVLSSEAAVWLRELLCLPTMLLGACRGLWELL